MTGLLTYLILKFLCLKFGVNFAFVLTPKSAVKSIRRTRRTFSSITHSLLPKKAIMPLVALDLVKYEPSMVMVHV